MNGRLFWDSSLHMRMFERLAYKERRRQPTTKLVIIRNYFILKIKISVGQKCVCEWNGLKYLTKKASQPITKRLLMELSFCFFFRFERIRAANYKLNVTWVIKIKRLNIYLRWKIRFCLRFESFCTWLTSRKTSTTRGEQTMEFTSPHFLWYFHHHLSGFCKIVDNVLSIG